MQKDRRFVGGVQAQVWKTNQLLLSLEDLVLKKANYFQQLSQETSLRVKLQHLSLMSTASMRLFTEY